MRRASFSINGISLSKLPLDDVFVKCGRWGCIKAGANYSHLLNTRGGSNKRGGGQNWANGEGGKSFLLHKKSCRGWNFSQNLINGHVKGGIFV